MLALFLLLSVARGQLSGCDPIDPTRCYLPFPNDYWRIPNGNGGFMLNYSTTTFPVTNNGEIFDPNEAGYNVMSGWPQHGACGTFFSNLSITNLPPYYHMQQSLLSTSPSILLDTSTGEIVPHFCELDWSSEFPRDMVGPPRYDQLLLLWPGLRLTDNTTYIVAFRDLVDTKGFPIPPSPAFLALRDNISTTDPDIEDRRALFNWMFTELEQDAGWNRNSVILCWSFTTALLSDTTGRLVFMRDDAMNRVANGIQFEIKSIVDNYSSNIIRKIEGWLTEPTYVDSNVPGAHLVINNTNGLPIYQGLNPRADFEILIPQSLVQNNSGVYTTKIGDILQYGHGLFGNRHEVQSGYLQQQANQYGYVLFASDWIGMSEYDVPTVVEMITFNFTNFKILPERTSQGILRALLLMRLAQQPNFQKSEAMTFGGQQVIGSSSNRWYYGNSNGGILGTVYSALSTDVKRTCLGVMGGPYSLMLPRSADFAPFYEIIKDRWRDSIDRISMVALIQVIWSRTDPAGYMGSVTSNPLPNTPAKTVLLQHALGDHQVSYVAAYVLGRSMQASMYQSNVNEPNEDLFGFPFVSDDALMSTTMQVTWNFTGVPPVPEIDIPPNRDTPDTHEGPRREQTAITMMHIFFINGTIINTCGGPCNAGPPPLKQNVTPSFYPYTDKS